jgi:hypothetical protein
MTPALRSGGVVAPYTGAEILFGAGMTGPAVSRRYQDGARIVARRADGELPAGHDVLFLLRADGQLAAVTEAGRPAPQAGDTIVSLGPAPARSRTGGNAGAVATGDTASPAAADEVAGPPGGLERP